MTDLASEPLYFVGGAGGDGTTTTVQLAARRIRDRGGRAIIVDPRGDTSLGTSRDPGKGVFEMAAWAMSLGWDLDETLDQHAKRIGDGVELLGERWDVPSLTRTREAAWAPAHVLHSVVDAACRRPGAVLVDLGTIRSAAAAGWLDVAPSTRRLVVATNRNSSRARTHSFLDNSQAAVSLLYREPGVSRRRDDMPIACGREAGVTADLDPRIAQMADAGELFFSESVDEAAFLDPALDWFGVTVSDELPPDISLG